MARLGEQYLPEIQPGHFPCSPDPVSYTHLDVYKRQLVLNQEHVDSAANDTFDKSGIAKNAREEKIRARDAKLKSDAENARMAKLYREEILGEKPPQDGFIPLGNLIGSAPKAAPVKEETAEPVMGD